MNSTIRKWISLGLSLSLSAGVLTVGASAASLRSDTTLSLDAITAQSDELTLAVVNFDSVWGDVDANVEKMTQYVEEAAEENVEFLVFPEMAVTGYAYSSDPSSEVYQMPIENAESADGEIARYFAALADEYDMWICYGATETIPGDSEHAYNSIFACSPDGEVTTYQKIHPVEGSWCVAGENPVMLDTEWGPVGISICYDTYAVPELERYYTASGCRLFLNLTATSRGSYSNEDGTLNTTSWQWYYEDRLESISDRDGVYIASCNLVGQEFDSSGNLLYAFPGGSCVIGPGGTADSGKYTAYYAGDPDWQEAGMSVSTIDLSKVYSVTETGLSTASTVSDILTSSNFQAELYASWYDDLASDSVEMASAPLVDEAVISVVNFNPVWGDLDANLAQMLDYIDQAAEEGTNILVFPEMALNGYCSSSDPTNEKYRLAVDTAITTDSVYAQTIAEAAAQYNMYIIFGASEEIPAEEKGDADQAYNSAFCCCPNGEIVTYRKIQPVEGSWCRAGDTPVIVETPYGALGLSICKDTYSYPELSRYYVAKGCTYIVNPTATSRGGQSRWSWYYDTRLESLCDRDKIVVVSADLCGSEYDADGNLLYTFPGGSCVLADLNRAEDGSYVSYVAGTGEYEPTAVGMYTGTLDLTDSRYNITYGSSISFFNPSLYSSWYASLTTSTSSSVAAISGSYEFSDVSYDRWSAPYVYDLFTSGVVSGYGDGTFLPEAEVTRAAFVKMLACVSGADLTQFSDISFADVAADDWFAPYVAWAAETGITVGTSDTTFSPNVPITRQDMAVMLLRFVETVDIDLTASLEPISFLDAEDIRSYAAEAVATLQTAGVLHGMETDDGFVFQPLASTTREQAATLLSLLTA